MGVWARLLGTDEATVAHRFVQMWETRIKPDLIAELATIPEEGPGVTQKDARALVRSFLEKTESRITTRANESMARSGKKTVKKSRETVETTES